MIKRLLSIVLIGLALISSAPCFAEIASGTSGTCKWSIDDKGVLTIEPTKGNEGKLANWLSEERVPWYKHREAIKKAVFKKTIVAPTCIYMFCECSKLESVDMANLNTDECTSMRSMFNNCNSLGNIDVSKFNTSKVTNMRYMFFDCSSVKTLDLRNFDTSNVTDMDGMFGYCSTLTTLNVSSFNTSKVTNMSQMFDNCKSIETIDLSNFDTSNVT